MDREVIEHINGMRKSINIIAIQGVCVCVCVPECLCVCVCVCVCVPPRD